MKIKKKILYPLEAIIFFTVMIFFRILPYEVASNLGGWLGRNIGPMLGITNRARRNLHLIYDRITPAKMEEIIKDMWDNHGRIVAELPHVPGLAKGKYKKYITFTGMEHINAARKNKKPIIFFSGHLANWEISSFTSLFINAPFNRVYRRANNPYIDWYIKNVREKLAGQMIPKGSSGARMMMDIVKNNGDLAILIDQKLNDGIKVPFMGRPAMTAPALASLALKFNAPILPLRLQRVNKHHFKISVEPEMKFDLTGDRHKDIAHIMTRVNEKMGSWIKEKPSQWFWMHRRWPKG